ncbi:MAG TPA: hypothetical protein VGE24_15650, partial [Emticicia sp.]
MKKRLYITSFTLFIISYFLIFPAFSQYTKSLYEKNSSQGFLGLSILDTDSVLKFAKESAAFDKPFFIKIKRLSKGSANPALAKRTDITTYTGAMVLPDTLHRPVPALPSGFVRASSVEIKTETPIPNPPTAKAPAKVVAIFLEGKKKHDELNANVHEFSPMATNGDVYEEKNDSEFIFIRIRPLKPEKSYKLTIVWRLDGEKFETEEYRFTTATQTLEKRLKQKIIPQIGVTAVLFKSTNSDGKVLKIYAKPSLMLGFHYYPRPIDPDISFSLKTYKPWALQRFS